MTIIGEKASVERQALEAKALRAMFDDFAAKNVSYAVLRNYESLPDSIGARDIDILVEPGDLSAACEVICALVRDMKLMFANFFRDERLTQFTLVRRLETDEIFDLKIDFFTSSQVYGVEVFSAIEMIEGARKHNGIPVVSESALILDKWSFHLIVGQPLNSKYDVAFAAIAQSEGETLKAELTPLFGGDVAQRLLARMAEGQGSTIGPLSGAVRRAAFWRMWRRQGLIAAPRSFLFLALRLRDRLSPNGLFLSVSGPDGCGKTTVIKRVTLQLEQIYGADGVVCRHFRPTVLPRIAEVAKKTHALKTVDEEYDRPHRAQPSGALGSVLRMGYYGLDYLFGYLRTIYPVLARRQVVLFDRYAYDMVCDPGRSRIALPTALIRTIIRLLPMPRWAFFIRVAPEEVFRRKQELDLDRIRQLNVRYDDLVRRGMLIAIDNEGEGPEDAAAQIVDTIIAQRDSRARQALGGLCK